MNLITPEISALPARRESGQSLVEFAISLVMLLVLVTGLVDVTRALFTYMSMRDAAQEAALYASMYPTYTSEINRRARNSSDFMQGLDGAINVIVSPTVGGHLCAGTTGGVNHGVKVRIYYAEFPLTMPLIGTFIGSNTVPISVEVISSIIVPPCN